LKSVAVVKAKIERVVRESLVLTPFVYVPMIPVASLISANGTVGLMIVAVAMVIPAFIVSLVASAVAELKN